MIKGRTRLVGLVGNPVAESLSPKMHNAAFAARGLDFAYVPLPVEAGRLENAVAGLVALGFAGGNVTIPYKTQVIAFCDELDPFAERAGSVNTLVIRDGRVHGSSSDGEAVVGAIEVAGVRVLLLGAGGAAQAVAASLVDTGAASITIAARDPERAHALALRLRALAQTTELRVAESWPPQGEEADVVVNCTPLRDEAPVAPRQGQGVVDLAYRADGAPTALVEAGLAAGCNPVVDGVEVLVRQGAAGFERWTGVSAPVEVMRAALRPILLSR
jgi:shikimate dehydrogenase